MAQTIPIQIRNTRKRNDVVAAPDSERKTFEDGVKIGA
jgi:hypothetical protein